MGAVILLCGRGRFSCIGVWKVATPSTPCLFCCPIAIILPMYSDCRKFLIFLHTFFKYKVSEVPPGALFFCIYTFKKSSAIIAYFQPYKMDHCGIEPKRTSPYLSSNNPILPAWGGLGPPRTARGQVTRHRVRAERKRSEAAWSKLASCRPVSPVPWPDRAKSQKPSITFWLYLCRNTQLPFMA